MKGGTATKILLEVAFSQAILWTATDNSRGTTVRVEAGLKQAGGDTYRTLLAAYETTHEHFYLQVCAVRLARLACDHIE